MNKWLRTSILLFSFTQIGAYAQEITQFTYGGNGSKFNGMVTVRYFAESENRRNALDSVADKIDLNEYRGNVKFLAEVSNLRLGLDGAFEGTKNSNHPKVFYLEMVRMKPTNRKWVLPMAADTVKISARGGHFGKNAGNISFGIKEVASQKEIHFRFKLRIRDGIYDRDWDGPIISKRIMVLPKAQEIKDTLKVVDESKAKKSSRRPVYYQRRYDDAKMAENENDSLNKPETIEDKLWAKIEQDLISDNKKSLLQRCQIYKMNCDQHIFTECEYSEDVLFFMASLVDDTQKPALINEYKNQYPSGKYIDKVDQLIVTPKITMIPIKKELVKLDFDQKTLMVNRVEGGSRPYHVGFFDYSKNKEYPIKSIGFNTDEISVELSALEIPEGSYIVKVWDAMGQVFVETEDVYVKEDVHVPNSVKLIVFFAFIGLMGVAYKRFIYF